MFQWADGKLRPKENKVALLPDEDGALSTVSALIQAKAYRSLVDFDNHMDNISLNYWVNPTVNEKIEELAS
jgi:predicted nucleic acid-binding protein